MQGQPDLSPSIDEDEDFSVDSLYDIDSMTAYAKERSELEKERR